MVSKGSVNNVLTNISYPQCNIQQVSEISSLYHFTVTQKFKKVAILHSEICKLIEQNNDKTTGTVTYNIILRKSFKINRL